MNNKKAGRPAGSKSTTNFNLGMLYQKFGQNCCPPISTVWLREQGLINDVKVEYKLPEVITQPTAQIKRIDFNQEND